jgi:hypothetical protein
MRRCWLGREPARRYHKLLAKAGANMIRAAIVALGLLFWAVPQTAHADFGSCTSYAYLNNFDARIRAEECDVITTVDIHWSGGTVQMRAIHPHSTAMDESAQFIARLEEAAERVGDAMDRMGGASLRLSNITVLFTDLRSPREGERDEGFDRDGYIAAARDGAEECPVTYYKGSHATMDGNDFVFTLAHEIFHCIEFRTWPGMPYEDWLIEGAAEYFAYLAKPDYDAGHITTFDARIPGHPLGGMSYAAVVFYLWMGDAYGPERVRDFVGSARSLEGAINSDMWIEFAQRYFDQSIRMPDGRPAPSTPQVGGTHVIHGDERMELPDMTPYTLNNAILAFDRDQSYTLTHAPLAADVRVLWKRSDNWIAPLTSVTTCNGEERFRVIWASTRSTAGSDTEIRAAEARDSVCTCPVGTWHETSASLRHMMEQSATGRPGAIEFVGGGRVLQLNPDHTGSFTYEGVITETHSSADFWLRQIKTGGSRFTWSTETGQLLTVLIPGDNLLNLYNERHSPSGVRVENRRAGAQSIGHNFYCDEAGLHLRLGEGRAWAPVPGMPNISMDMDFVRAGGPEH